jgi:hypothetical protein
VDACGRLCCAILTALKNMPYTMLEQVQHLFLKTKKLRQEGWAE